MVISLPIGTNYELRGSYPIATGLPKIAVQMERGMREEIAKNTMFRPSRDRSRSPDRASMLIMGRGHDWGHGTDGGHDGQGRQGQRSIYRIIRGSRMLPLYDLECLRQHPHLERRFTVSDCEDAQGQGDRGLGAQWIDCGRIRRGVHKPCRKWGR